jgi:hypothetical protein
LPAHGGDAMVCLGTGTSIHGLGGDSSDSDSIIPNSTGIGDTGNTGQKPNRQGLGDGASFIHLAQHTSVSSSRPRRPTRRSDGAQTELEQGISSLRVSRTGKRKAQTDH